jgi:hypothetical protein
LLSTLVLAGFLALPGAAMAQDDSNVFDDLLTEDEDDSFEIQPSGEEGQLEEGDPMEFEEPEDDLDFSDPVPGDDPDADPLDAPDLLGDDPTPDEPLGTDSAELYRATLDRVRGMDPDEEMQVWDAYLRQHPTTTFRGQIEKRVTELEDALYDLNRIREPDPEPGDADEQQLGFSQGVLLENINPRQRVMVLIEYGLPDYAGFGADYEHPLSRSFSVHGGLRRRFTGANVEAGARWAVVKSARTHTFVTLIGDVRFNVAPAFVAFRPQVAAGKRFGKLDLQGQAGVDIAPRQILDFRITGGLNATYRASDAVAVFAETSVFMSSLSGDFGLYRFNTVTFGMKFFPRQKAEKPENTEINLGAAVPYSSAYWQYHFGSLTGQGVFYLD